MSHLKEIFRAFIDRSDSDIQPHPLMQNLPPEVCCKVALLGAGNSTALLRNAIMSIAKVGIPPSDIVVGRFRGDAQECEIAATGVSIFYLEQLGANVPTAQNYAEYGTPRFSDLMNVRFSFLDHLLNDGNMVICADVDIAWFRNPIPLLRDTMRYWDWASQVEPIEISPPSFCNGFFCMKPSSEAIELLRAHHELFLSARQLDPNATTQPVFMQLLEKRPDFLSRIFPLSEVLFPTGTSYRLFDKENPQDGLLKTLNPYVFHANWTIGEADKIHLLKRVGGWHFD